MGRKMADTPKDKTAPPQTDSQHFATRSTSLPFGRHVALDHIAGPTYVTTQLLVQQVAYQLSDRVWTYAPESFDLDVALQQWHAEGAINSRGRVSSLDAVQVRHGAASMALGYCFSKDFDPLQRHVPQSIVSTSASLPYLRSALDELSLLYALASPFVAHVAAVDYAGASSQLVADYMTGMTLAEDLGLGMVASSSVYEAQHMALFATLLATILPTLHIYDGVTVGRETSRVIDVLDQAGLARVAANVLRDFAAQQPTKRNESSDSRALRLLDAFNAELGTQYEAFEYHGAPDAEHVLVMFGTVESALATQIVASLAANDVKIGVVSVRMYRPFAEESFLAKLPPSVRSIAVLGQVGSETAVSEAAVSSALYADVLGATAFASKWALPPTVTDLKYAREKTWTPVSMATAFQILIGKPVLQEAFNINPETLQPTRAVSIDQFSFWDLDVSPSVNAAGVVAQALAIDSAHNITSRTTYDNLLLGGVIRSDIRRSKKTVEVPYSIDQANFAYIGDLSLLKKLAVTNSVKAGALVLLRLPGVKDEDLEAKLPLPFQQAVGNKKISLFILDPDAIEELKERPEDETFLVQAAFLRVALPGLEEVGLQRLTSVNGSEQTFRDISTKLETALRQVEVPESWAEVQVDADAAIERADIWPNSFTPLDKTEQDLPSYLRDWQTAAKGLAFKEAYNTQIALRPDLAVKTYTVTVKENRRLTPLSYDRNIFHIEFDLGTSGLKYDIGEALGIHPENDPVMVQEFIDTYKLDPDNVVEVPSREDPRVLENRTVWQALVQNIDLFGRPPKRFYEALAEFASETKEATELRALGGPEGANEFKRRAEVDTVTFADVLLEFPSAHPSFHDIVRIVDPIKRREYSIASCQKVTPTSVALMIVVVGWVDPRGRDRFGMATRYLQRLRPGVAVTASVKPSVMKLPPKSTQPLIMAGLGTGLAPFRAFVQHRALEKAQGKEIGAVLLYMGSRHQREEYCYGEEWEAYMDAGIITLMGKAFSRDQPQKIYIQDRMRQTLDDIVQAYMKEDGAFYLCGPTWPVPDVTQVLEEAIAREGRSSGKKVNPRKEIEKLKDDGRYVLEVY